MDVFLDAVLMPFSSHLFYTFSISVTIYISFHDTTQS